MSTLIELNALRTAAGMKPLKAWKESKAKLDAAIAKLGAKPSNVEVTKVPTGMTAAKKEKADAKASKPVKVPATKTTKVKVVKDKKSTGEGLSISTIAEELDIDPKVARAKMRRAFGLKEEGKWPTSIAEVKKVLQTDARKKEA